MISKTKIGNRVRKKTDNYIVETLLDAKKNKAWMKVAQKISGSSRNYSSINLKRIDSETKEGDTVVVVGKVLGTGSLNKKLRICAISFSESAKEKLNKNKSEMVLLKDEIKKNPKAEGVKIIA